MAQTLLMLSEPSLRTQRELDKFHALFFPSFCHFLSSSTSEKKPFLNFKRRMTSTDICMNDQRTPWPFRLADAMWRFIFLLFFFFFCSLFFDSMSAVGAHRPYSLFLTSSSVLFTWSRTCWNHTAKRRLCMENILGTYIETGLKHSFASSSRNVNEYWIRSLLAIGEWKGGSNR